MSFDKAKYPFGRGLCVEIRDGNLEKALKILKKKMANEGVLKELRERKEFEKPSAKKRRQHAEAVRRAYRKRMEESMEFNGF